MAPEMEGGTMIAYAYIKKGRFELVDKPRIFIYSRCTEIRCCNGSQIVRCVGT